MQIIAAIILFKEISFKLIVTVVQNELRLTEKMSFCHTKSNLFAFVPVFKKVIGYPLDLFACGNRELHATPRISGIYRWENLISNI
jgi:hypothetical protein